MVHYHHPLPEVIIALPFGIALGYLVLRTRSILPAILLIVFVSTYIIPILMMTGGRT